MVSIRNRFFILVILVVVTLLLAMPAPVKADGGPILSDSELWAQLREGQQTAVITLKDGNTADIDLFVSMLDDSGQSHEVVFFVPLGTAATEFSVAEKTSLNFDQELTGKLDRILRREASLKKDIRLSLVSGALLINGVWLFPLWIPILLSGCAADEPVATFETESSQVAIYGLDRW